MHHRIIFPTKDSCYNLLILTPNVPPTGTKSRVETQVRVALDLALPSGPSGDPQSYDRVGSWKWLKLPKGTATRKRSRKEGKIDAAPSDTLFMDTEVTCASNPSKHVLSCSTCQGREAKRVARKIAARVRPARSDSDSNEGDNGSSSKIVQFNCPDTLDFSGGSVVLPLRITCYCRHHREKVGFNVHFTMRDSSGRIVGSGMSPPIMITDDHKSIDKSASKHQHMPSYSADSDWNSRPSFVPTPCEPAAATGSAPSKRRQSATKDGAAPSKRRAKPYDNDRESANRTRRGGPTGDNSQPTVNTTVPNFAVMDRDGQMITPFSPFAPSGLTDAIPPTSYHQRRDSTTALPSPSNSMHTPLSPQTSYSESADSIMHEVLCQPYSFFPLSPPETAPSSPPSQDVSSAAAELSPFNYTMLHPSPDQIPPSLPAPKIHRLIPSSGPTFGGIEVTVLGSNFHPSVLHNCVFGDVVASSTTRWSENTLVCVLPPRATAGVVPVTLEGLKMDTNGPPALFTYVDDTDRTLMELALQVVGLKMTGKIEDAKDIAMRIVGSSQDPHNGNGTTNQMMHLANGALPDSRRLFLARGDDAEFEKIVMDSLTSLDMRGSSGEPLSLSSVVSHQTKTGQTLLHLAASLNFSSLVEFLIQRDILLDTQDINGYTALHFAILRGSQCCARQIINAGADTTICTNMGYTALELAPDDFFGAPREYYETPSEISDDESNFGDVEEDSGSESRSRSRMQSRRRVRLPRSRRSSKPASVVASDVSDVEEPFDAHAAAEDDDNATVVSPEALPMSDTVGKDATIDEKQAASFAAYLQRAWAQFHPPPLRAPIPQLPGMPAWVFPVFVPMQAWPPFRNGRHDRGNDEKKLAEEDDAPSSPPTWEEWMAQMGEMGAEGLEKPLSSKEANLDADEVVPEPPVAPAPTASRSILRRFRYKQRPVQVSEQEIQSYTYRPKNKALTKTVKKEDRMLFVFWIPILLLAIGWALYASRSAISMAQQYIPWEDIASRLKVAA
ncbi:uncharacterized protein FOMMEDRAFT_20270 [Fomitiporia mediterranea MF3/22]|uniref:uncharacterized protein n=1 Tax=Fomitiporia mediterranea (strain MF3/22) TaxID=694068 RepID=UPI00044085B4|nr:uncharacterized protein FOMMEDRAFT_20270 [Fomitiporia mediterranea MF3/22]EJD03106.1 hypothetical protein FOMMEDRAFT_20270 [Fomitiporia mediterranea MF3/22]